MVPSSLPRFFHSPFLSSDPLVASVLKSMGMMLSSLLVSPQIKFMFFVIEDGWHLLIGSLVSGFGKGWE